MEVRPIFYRGLFWCLLFALQTLFICTLHAQPVKAYSIKNGRMYVQLPKHLSADALDRFITQYDLADLDLKSFLKTNNSDSLARLGWRVDVNNETGLIISKKLEPFEGWNNIDDRFILKEKGEPLFPAVNNGLVYGSNNFRNKQAFALRDSTVRFYLRANQQAGKVWLAGSFNNWAPAQLAMQKVDSGWIYDVKLGPGKYWYKFIVDGAWIVDRDNLLSESDGRGNVNSVYFRPNALFALPGFAAAKAVFLSGSFNGWKPDALRMKKTATGWELPLYLANGTHTYKFVVDGRWYKDPQNADMVPDGVGSFNSVIRHGKPYLFRLTGFREAKEVMLLGSFNQWRDFEWSMKKTPGGWELPYTLGPGNYEYKFKVDGKLIADPTNPLSSAASGSSYLILEPNYTFRLSGFAGAKQVYLAGDFNNWDPKSYPMKREDAAWVFPVHLAVGKHLYKFIVDDKWIIDPANKLWEQNEYGNGNSVLWIEN